MAVATRTLAHSTLLDSLGDTAGSASSLKPAAIDNDVIEGMLKRGRRWRMPAPIVATGCSLPVIEPASGTATWDRRLRRAAPFGLSFFVSLGLHLAVLLLAALVATNSASQSTPLIVVEGRLLESNPEELVPVEMPLAVTTGEAKSEEVADVATFAAIELDPGAMQGGVPQLELMDTSAGVVNTLLADLAGLTDEIGDGQSSAGDGLGGSGGKPDGEEGAEFFGVQASGRKFVFVCDCSRSMAGLKWLELNRELSRCIGELGPSKSFYVVFFDGEMHPMFEPFNREPALLEANAENIDKARYWIANVALGANTSPCESVKFAASLEPDAMFLLTDGEFSDYTAPYLRDFNKKRVAKGKPKVAVHTIGLLSQKHQRVLERIAKDSGGSYKFVGP